MMTKAIMLKYQTMKIQSLVEHIQKESEENSKEENLTIKDPEVKFLLQEILDLINNNKNIKEIIDKNKLGNKYKKRGINSFKGAVLCDLSVVLMPLALVALVLEIVSFAKSEKLSRAAMQEINELSQKVNNLKECIEKEKKENEKDKEFEVETLWEFKKFIEEQGKEYIKTKTKSKSAMSILIEPKDPLLKSDDIQSKKFDKKRANELEKFRKKDEKGRLNIDALKIKFAMCIQHFTLNPKFSKTAEQDSD